MIWQIIQLEKGRQLNELWNQTALAWIRCGQGCNLPTIIFMTIVDDSRYHDYIPQDQFLATSFWAISCFFSAVSDYANSIYQGIVDMPQVVLVVKSRLFWWSKAASPAIVRLWFEPDIAVGDSLCGYPDGAIIDNARGAKGQEQPIITAHRLDCSCPYRFDLVTKWTDIERGNALDGWYAQTTIQQLKQKERRCRINRTMGCIEALDVYLKPYGSFFGTQFFSCDDGH